MKPTTPKILVVMPYWEGDRAVAQAAAQQAAALMSDPHDDFGFMFVGRNDARPIPRGVLYDMEKKFPFDVKYWKCDRQGVGFPMGPNELYFGIFNYAVDRKSGMDKYDAMLILESDVVITRKDWHLEVLAEWDATVAEGKKVSGAVINAGYGDYPKHINASALYKRDLKTYIPTLIGCSGQVGWDYFFGQKIIPVARDSSLFYLDYQKPTITKEELFTIRTGDKPPLFYHGVKDDSARKIIAKKLLGEESLEDRAIMSPEEYGRMNGFASKKNPDGTYTLSKI